MRTSPRSSETSQQESTQRRQPWFARLLFRIGLILAGVMALFNCINGLGSAIDPRFGQVDPTLPPQPLWVSLMLLAFGVLTLVALAPAWRCRRRGIWVVALSRLAEAWSAFLLLLVPGLPARDVWLLIAVLVPVGTIVAAMVASGLRRWR